MKHIISEIQLSLYCYNTSKTKQHVSKTEATFWSFLSNTWGPFEENIGYEKRVHLSCSKDLFRISLDEVRAS